MREFKVTKAEEGLSVLKRSGRLLSEAPASILHKFIRNKNIELNGSKTAPDTKVVNGDRLLFFLSDETYEKFSGSKKSASGRTSDTSGGSGACSLKHDLRADIIYEDWNVLIINKAPGLLSQGSSKNEKSLNDLILEYLSYDQGKDIIKPSICNRLDRNTSGLILAGKTAAALQGLSSILSSRELKKHYLAIVFGHASLNGRYEAFIKKDSGKNICEVIKEEKEGFLKIVTGFSVKKHFIYMNTELSLIEAELITGRSHQIRAHLKYLGYPVLGDRKYFSQQSLMTGNTLKIKRQLLHSFSMEFPRLDGALSHLSGRIFTAALPADMELY